MESTLITNPILWSDVPDVDVIRAEDTFYMVSTSMHTVPGCPIMRSRDLMHWEIVSYVFDILEDNDAQNLLDGRGIYGQGSWAASLRYHAGRFYVAFSSNDQQKFYLYQTVDLERGPWRRTVLEGVYHDPALLFDGDHLYVLYGCGSIRIRELLPDGSGLKPGGVDQVLLETETEGIGLRCEGGHAYRIDGQYYLLYIEWPTGGNARRREVCYRSDSLLGPYRRKVILDDDMGYQNQGVAQGAIFDTPAGDWYAMLFQDHGAVGRIPCVLPVRWEEGWPMLGADGKVPQKFSVPLSPAPTGPLVANDEFDRRENRLNLQWQWNHNPENSLWSLTERPGWLRLRTGNLAGDVLRARNTLTQRTMGPRCEGSTLLDLTGLRPGDRAGLLALQSNFGAVGVQVDRNGERALTMETKEGGCFSLPLSQDQVHLKICFDFVQSRDLALFLYSLDGERWEQAGPPLQMKYTLDHFMGYRLGLYCYSTLQPGGHADFDFFHFSVK